MSFSALGQVLIIDCHTIVVYTERNGCTGTDIYGKAHEHSAVSCLSTLCRGCDNNVDLVEALRGRMQEHAGERPMAALQLRLKHA